MSEPSVQMELSLCETLTEPQIDQLMDLYKREWWSNTRVRADVLRMLAGSDIVVALVVAETGELCAFGRVLTDFVYKALICDIIVSPQHRGAGLGCRIMETIINHPDLRTVRHLELYCRPELASFYHRWGFTEELGGILLMRRMSNAEDGE